MDRAPEQRMPKHRRPATAGATLSTAVAAMDVGGLTRQAAMIVVGRVKDVTDVGRTEIPAFRGPILWTDYLLAVEEHLDPQRSERVDQLTIRNLGGWDGEVSMEAPDEPNFEVGEKVLVFLSKDTGGLFALSDYAFTILGGFQGKYSIWRAQPPEPTGLDFAVDESRRSLRPLAALRAEILDHLSF